MSDQTELPMFRLQSRRSDPDSSRAAACRAEPGARSIAGQALYYIRGHPGCLAEDIAEAINRPAYEVRKRTADLRRLNLAWSESCDAECLRWYAEWVDDD